MNILQVGFVGLWDLSCAPPHEYKTTLCTIDLRRTSPTYIVYHGAQVGVDPDTQDIPNFLKKIIHDADADIYNFL